MKKPNLNIEKNFIDRAMEFISPARAVRRQQARVMLALTGGYSGAKVDRNALANWKSGAGSPEADISPDLVNLRSRSRDLVRNTPVATGAVGLSVSNVIGTGLSLQPTVDYEFLGLDEDAASEWAAAVKREWRLFANSKDADITRHLNFYQLQALIYRSRMESGDVFVLTPSIKRNNPYDLTLQVVEADRVCNSDYQANSNTLVDGVELDQYGAPIKYHIAKNHPGTLRQNNMQWTKVDAYGAKGRKNVLHIYKQFRPGQVRGVPDFAPIIEPLKQLARYTEAELQAAVTSGMFAIFVKMDPEAFGDLFDDGGKQTIVDGAKKWTGNLDSGGKAINLLPGESVETANPSRPNSEFDPFVQSIIRQIGMALEIPYEVLIMHYQSSYSAARAAMLNAWRNWRIQRDWMATDLCQPIYELWLEEAIAKNRVRAPGFFADPAVKAAWCAAQWIGDGPGSLDPVKEVEAAKMRVELGISTIEAESILHDGGDWETKHTQRVKEQAERLEGGLIMDTAAKPAAPLVDAEDGTDNTDTEDAANNADPADNENENALEQSFKNINARLDMLFTKDTQVNITTGATNVTIPDREVTIQPANVLITNNLPEPVTHMEAHIDVPAAEVVVNLPKPAAVHKDVKRDKSGDISSIIETITYEVTNEPVI